MKKTDIGVLVFDGTQEDMTFEKEIIKQLQHFNIPTIGIINKSDIQSSEVTEDFFTKALGIQCYLASARTKEGIETIKDVMARILPAESERFLIGDLLQPLDVVLLVIPIDKAAPKGRIILPQQQIIRELLDFGCIPIICKETELKETFIKLVCPPKLVITDSQVFRYVNALTPSDIALTSFSIIFARYKGKFNQFLAGTAAIDLLQDGDNILISEACTHHRQEDDIGTVKLPKWLLEKTEKKLCFTHVSGNDYPKNLKNYQLIIHCGACMLNQKGMTRRIQEAVEAGVPITNYGLAIAKINGILERATEIFL